MSCKQKTRMYQFFPEKIKANADKFTDYQNEKKKEESNEKLILKLTDKEDYVSDG